MPSTLIAIGLLISIFFLLRKKYKFAIFSLISVFLTYYLLSIEPVAYYLAAGLECRSEISEFKEYDEDIEVIVVLSGGAIKKGEGSPLSELGGTSWQRLWRGIEVYREFQGQIPILYSGGKGDLFDTISIEAALAKSYAVTAGIPEEMFWIEPKSRNTYESGIAIKRTLEEYFPGVNKHKVLLVTSALHMPRAMGVLEKIEIQVFPMPAAFVMSSLNLDPFSFFPSHGYFGISSLAIHEWIGNMCYKLLGRI